MAKGRISAQELKHDPLMDQYLKTHNWVKGRSQPLSKWLTIAVVVLALIAIGWFIFSRRSGNAAESMAEAFRVNDAIVQNPIPPALQVGQYAFTTQDEKHRKAYEAFEKAGRDYPSYHGDVARFHAATHQLYFEPEKAEATLQELAQKDSAVGAQARMALANRYEAGGKYDQAVAEYQKLKAKPGDIPPLLIDFAVARTQEAAGKNKEAADLYFNIAKEQRDSALGSQAVTRLTSLAPERVEQLPETSTGKPGGGSMPITIK